MSTVIDSPLIDYFLVTSYLLQTLHHGLHVLCVHLICHCLHQGLEMMHETRGTTLYYMKPAGAHWQHLVTTANDKGVSL